MLKQKIKVWIQNLVLSLTFSNSNNRTLFSRYFQLFLNVGSIFILCMIFGLLILFLFSQYLTDHAEAQVITLSWLMFTKNYPLYHAPDAVERYNLIFGPILYLLEGAILYLFQPSLFASKILIVFAFILSFVCIFIAISRLSNLTAGLRGIVIAGLSILYFGNIYGNTFFSIRPDVLIFLCVSLAFLSITCFSPALSTVIYMIALGVAINLKIHTFFYFVPFYVILASRIKRVFIIISLAGSVAIALLPFLLPQISLSYYLHWLRKIANHGLSWETFKNNSVFSLYFLLILFSLILQFYLTNSDELKKFSHQQKKYFYALFGSMLAVIFIAAKPGSGHHHLLPFLPSFLYIYSLVINENEKIKKKYIKLDRLSIYYKKIIVTVLLNLSIFLFILYHAGIQSVFLSEIYMISSQQVIDDIQQVQSDFTEQIIAMGYGEHKNYPLTYYRFLLAFTGNPYLIDPLTLMDTKKAGLDISDDILKILSTCKIEIWLIPKDDPPFQQRSYYPPNPKIFSDEFQTTFLENYEKRKQSHYFDLWYCREARSTNLHQYTR